MEIDLPAGKYVVAVSGGVDSVVLLDMLTKLPGMKLTVAHFDHGIRSDSAEDRRHVEDLARQYGLPFVYHAAALGPRTSEATARQARYAFLHQVRQASGAAAMVTAHHQDDVVETVILNLLRGTGRRGLSSLQSTDSIRRPLLGVPKKELLRYAKGQGLSWREDSTNTDERYLRNYVRRRLLPRFAKTDREVLLQMVGQAADSNAALAVELANYLHLQPAAQVLNRHQFTLLPHAVAREVMAEWLLQNTPITLDSRTLERLVVGAKTGRIGSRINAGSGHWMYITAGTLALRPRER